MAVIWHYWEKRVEKRMIKPGEAIPPRFAVAEEALETFTLIDEFDNNVVDEFDNNIVGPASG